jgi:hypothetical protein
MRRLRLLSAPPSIAIDIEPLDGVVDADWPPVSVEGFEILPAWQVRPARGRRRIMATLPALAVAAAVALSVDRGHDPTPLRAGPVRQHGTVRPALVVQASPAPSNADSSGRR